VTGTHRGPSPGPALPAPRRRLVAAYPGQVTLPVADTPSTPPAAFAAAATALRRLAERGPLNEVTLFESAAPTRVAPFGVALSAELLAAPLVGSAAPRETDSDAAEPEPVASGRFIVLHDPEGQPGWDADTRVVAFVRADVDPDMARDPLLAEVVWLWLGDALTAHNAQARAQGGTVTVTSSRRFGALAVDADPDLAPDEVSSRESCEVELRCSWTPVQFPTESLTDTLTSHLGAFCDLLATTAGRPPLGTGVVTLRPRP
jgi:hypothetical protein